MPLVIYLGFERSLGGDMTVMLAGVSVSLHGVTEEPE